MRAHIVSALLAVVVSFALSGAASARHDAPVSLRIVNLSGSISRLGSMDSLPLYGLRLKAIVCFGSASQALNTYPDAIGITHYAVRKSPRDWWPARSVIDRAPWLVPFGETWHGKACGATWLEDPIPAQHYGVESLGNPLVCYGVGLTIWARGVQASRRAIATCRPRFG